MAWYLKNMKTRIIGNIDKNKQNEVKHRKKAYKIETKKRTLK